MKAMTMWTTTGAMITATRTMKKKSMATAIKVTNPN
jgi:hypothetical protein